MTAMQATQPGQGPRRLLLLQLLKRRASNGLRCQFVISGRNPLLSFPWMFFSHESFQIPSPFNDIAAFRKYSYQAKWINTVQRQHREIRLCFGNCAGRADGADDFTAAD